ncbi:MAG: T9SS type A sorting domain-containing protein [Bacteroidetes bacterium]|nr:T9SS type A sorting domain-containing protein [Bacteroidota bacterium]
MFTSTSASINPLNALSGSISIYPNPSSGIFNIKLLNPSLTKANVVAEVYNYTGAKVYSYSGSVFHDGFQIDLTGFSKGVYILKITLADKKVSTQKIIIK